MSFSGEVKRTSLCSFNQNSWFRSYILILHVYNFHIKTLSLSLSACVNSWSSVRVEENGVDSAPVEKGSDRGRRGKGRGTRMQTWTDTHTQIHTLTLFSVLGSLLSFTCVCSVWRQGERPCPRGQQVHSTGNGVSVIKRAHIICWVFTPLWWFTHLLRFS